MKNLKTFKVTLKSSKSRMLPTKGNCFSCNEVSSPIWQFFKTNRGIVTLCKPCRDRAITKFNKKRDDSNEENSLKFTNRSCRKHSYDDAMNHAIRSGQFESNRRRH
ncbi:hypothetical protein B5V00_08590 [Geothermobacter hydrogeniphilus]|uniref:Uncharacterized protein n=1 Tax=Geothermobacter hydrogeniphilus TaxID=1969733 RepID=A0A1X0Y597_9BACT|nr:hypothetical protein B5V00_08590 [Geothermobacter hydrogeniphilus]